MVDTKKASSDRRDEEEPLLKSKRHTAENESSTSIEHAREDEWDSEDNPKNPRNWPAWYRWLTVVLVSFIELLTTMPNFMYAPNINDAQKDLHSEDETLATFSLTIYILGFGLGPLLFAPLSEMYGRALIYRACLSAFLVMTVGCALSVNLSMLVAFRFLAGSFGAAPVAIGGAVVGDIFPAGERGTAMSIYQAGLIIAAVIGPPIGGLIGASLNWRWIFWIVCCMTALALLFTFVILKETHAPTLKRSIHQSGTLGSNGAGADKRLGLIAELKGTLSRPLKLLTQSPVVFLSCALIFLIIGLLNVFLTLMSRVFQTIYHMSSATSGLVYLGLGLGFVIASTVFGLTNDKIMHLLTRKHKGETLPEFRLPATIATMPLIAVGFLWYGWALHSRTSWVVPMVGSALAGVGITTVQLSITTYIVDSFDEFSASALAAITLARSVGGAVLPLAGPLLYKRLGLGWGNSVLAIVALMSCPIPVLLYKFGPRWRGMLTAKDL